MHAACGGLRKCQCLKKSSSYWNNSVRLDAHAVRLDHVLLRADGYGILLVDTRLGTVHVMFGSQLYA